MIRESSAIDHVTPSHHVAKYLKLKTRLKLNDCLWPVVQFVSVLREKNKDTTVKKERKDRIANRKKMEKITGVARCADYFWREWERNVKVKYNLKNKTDAKVL